MQLIFGLSCFRGMKMQKWIFWWEGLRMKQECLLNIYGQVTGVPCSLFKTWQSYGRFFVAKVFSEMPKAGLFSFLNVCRERRDQVNFVQICFKSQTFFDGCWVVAYWLHLILCNLWLFCYIDIFGTFCADKVFLSCQVAGVCGHPKGLFCWCMPILIFKYMGKGEIGSTLYTFVTHAKRYLHCPLEWKQVCL